MRGTGSKGFTLVEVMVSLTCMVIALTAIYRMHLASAITDGHNNLEMEAMSLCNQQLETLRLSDFGNIASSTAPVTSTEPFSMTWVVTQPLTWQKRVVVTVSWSDSAGAAVTRRVTRSVQMSTIISNMTFGT